MKIIKGMEDIYSIKKGQRKIIKETTFWEDIEQIMNRKVDTKDHTQITAIFNDISITTEKNSNWEAITIAKDKNDKFYWFSHNKNQNIPELLYYQQATEFISWKNNKIA